MGGSIAGKGKGVVTAATLGLGGASGGSGQSNAVMAVGGSLAGGGVGGGHGGKHK